ncbi:MAG: hypothetical protein ACK2UB_04880, partial [Anaerolineales bacterium]
MILQPEVIVVSLISVLGLWLPGAALLVWQPERRRTLMEGLAVSFGLGIVLAALAALAGRIASISITPSLFLLLEAVAAVLLVLGCIRRKPRVRISVFAGAELLALLALLGLRFFQARDLALPAWVDSVHHAFLTRLILEQGGIPLDLQPWIPGPFYYHFGFHTSAAVMAAISGLTPDRAILVFGQILNAASALSIYRLSMAIRPDRRRALLAMALAGFVAQMPAYYLAWGRYTLLAGMVLLPLAMAEAIVLARDRDVASGGRGAAGIRLALFTAGVLLTHYLTGVLLALFLAVLGISLLSKRIRRGAFVRLALAVGVGTAAALPWLIPMLRYSSGSIGVDVVSSNAAVTETYFVEYAVYIWKLLGPLRNYLLLGAGLLAGLTALARRGPLRGFAVWGIILGLQTLPWGVRIAPFRPDHLAIVLFLPATVLVADGSARLAEWIRRRRPALRPRFFLAGAALGCCVVGIWQTRTIVPAATILADSDDRTAVIWAGDHT